MYVAVREQPTATGTFRAVTIGKGSPFAKCDLVEVWAELNTLEGCTGTDIWGGGDLVGGSPRAHGTTLSLLTIMDVAAAAYVPR